MYHFPLTTSTVPLFHQMQIITPKFPLAVRKHSDKKKDGHGCRFFPQQWYQTGEASTSSQEPSFKLSGTLWALCDLITSFKLAMVENYHHRNHKHCWSGLFCLFSKKLIVGPNHHLPGELATVSSPFQILFFYIHKIGIVISIPQKHFSKWEQWIWKRLGNYKTMDKYLHLFSPSHPSP